MLSFWHRIFHKCSFRNCALSETVLFQKLCSFFSARPTDLNWACSGNLISRARQTIRLRIQKSPIVGHQGSKRERDQELGDSEYD